MRTPSGKHVGHLTLFLISVVANPSITVVQASDGFTVFGAPVGLINVAINLQANYVTGMAADAINGGTGDWKSTFQQVVSTGCMLEQLDLVSNSCADLYIRYKFKFHKEKDSHLRLGTVQETRLRESVSVTSSLFYIVVMTMTGLNDIRSGMFLWAFVMGCNIVAQLGVTGARYLHTAGYAYLPTCSVHRKMRLLERSTVVLLCIAWAVLVFLKPDVTFGTTRGILGDALYWLGGSWLFSMMVTYAGKILGIMNDSAPARIWRVIQFLIALVTWGVRMMSYNCLLDSCVGKNDPPTQIDGM
ncbi:hypothetical protein SpCBS45565_g03774 [Spizellomyces sp. 'palustris']|nr:hypothetical protein SpCBS45565_g03774 [Spizellomyces sp. 'palustris']